MAGSQGRGRTIRCDLAGRLRNECQNQRALLCVAINRPGAMCIPRGPGRDPQGENPDGIAHTTRDVLTALAGNGDGLCSAADAFSHGARSSRGAGVQLGRSAAALRRVARQLLSRRRGTFGSLDEAGPAAVGLVVALAASLCEVAAWRPKQDREHQTAASFSAADTVSEAPPEMAGSPEVVGTGVGSSVRHRPEGAPRVS
jgi:hypothetical protein